VLEECDERLAVQALVKRLPSVGEIGISHEIRIAFPLLEQVGELDEVFGPNEVAVPGALAKARAQRRR
jgi:hypothetical protein